MDQISDIPSAIGDFDVLGELARSETSVVLRACQRSLDRIVALKVVRSEWVSDPTELERFLRGAKSAARLDHPQIVRIFDVGCVDDLHYYAMAFVDGESLAIRVKTRGPLPPRVAAELVRRVAQATAFTHANKIVHRGLSPECVLLEADGQPRVTGFGLARPTEPGHTLTAAGTQLDAYTAPETLGATVPAMSPLIDVYGLGAILYFALTGRPPHAANSVTELATQIAEEPAVSPRKHNPKVPRALEAVCLRCLANQPGERYPTAQAVVEALDEILGGSRVVASRNVVSAGQPTPGTVAFADTGPIAQDTTGHKLAPSPSVARNRRWLVGVAGIIIVGVLMGAYMALRPGVPSPAKPLANAEPPQRHLETPPELSLDQPIPATPTATSEASEERLFQDVRIAERKITGGLTEEGWTFGYADAAEGFAQAFRDYGMDIGKHSTTELVTFYEATPEQHRKTIRYWLTRWELCATAANRPEVESIRTLLAVIEDDAWEQQFLGARSDPNPARLLALATATAKVLSIGDPTPCELVIEALFARGLDAKPETLTLVRTAYGFFTRTRVWPNIRYAQLQLPVAERAVGMERIRQTDNIAGYLRAALASSAEQDSALKARIAGIEKLTPSFAVEREIAEWVLAQGGSVTINGYPWREYEQHVYRVADLPPHPFRVLGVSLNGTASDDSNVARLAQLSCCKQLYLAGCPITDDGLAPLLDKLPLTDLDLENSKISNATLERLTRLTRLKLHGTMVTPSGTAKLRELNPQLQFVDDEIAGHSPEGPDTGFALRIDEGAWGDVPVFVDGVASLTVEAMILVPFELRSNSMFAVYGQSDQKIGRFAINVMLDSAATSIQRNTGAFTGGSLENSKLPLNQLCHIASVADGPVCRTFLNGKLVWTLNEPARATAGRYRFSIGRSPTISGERFRGVIDEVRISSVARYTGDFTPALRHEPDEHTLALYHFDEGEGDIAIDSSGHGHDGKIFGAKWIKASNGIGP